MMNHAERELALERMDQTIRRFHSAAIGIGNHPFVEFAGLMTAYLKSCRAAHEQGVDFSECNRHSGSRLPMHGFEVDYLADKLDGIFAGYLNISRASNYSRDNT